MNRLLAIMLSICLFVSCGDVVDDTSKLVLDNFTFITDFPEEKSVKSSEEIELHIGNYNVLSMTIKDSLLMVSTHKNEQVVYVYDVSDFSCLGSFFKIGNGPSELLKTFYMNYARIFYSGHSIMLEFSNGRKEIVRWNVSQSLIRNETVAESRPLPSTSAYSGLWMILDDSTSFCRTISSDELKNEREVYVGTILKKVDAFTKLNGIEVSTNRYPYFNLLSGYPAYNEENRIFVDASISTNVINFVALDNNFSKTVIVGREVVSVHEAEKYCNRHHKERQFFFSQSSDDTLCAFLFSEKSKDYSILFFDWYGEPKLKVNLPHPATDFCFDSSKHVIYALDSENEKIYRYEY